MHYKKKYNNQTQYSIQGLRPVSKSLPSGLKTILKKGGYNYSSIINNWTKLVGKKIADVCYPKSIKTSKDLKDGILHLNVTHGDQIMVEYNKAEIIDKINTFFGYEFIKQIKIVLLNVKIETKKENFLNKKKETKYHKKLKDINNPDLKKKLDKLINAFSGK
tara:strand:- start:267 stop:752 length:486 start_codon:yes stop_codon:yes gene_type:complete